MSRKSDVLTEIFKICKQKGDYEFDNYLVKKVSEKFNFGNPFDATKIDNKGKLPQILLDNDYAIIHLGKGGKHKFIKGIDKVYHDFEPIQQELEWQYKKSILNLHNTSESNTLSVANNQRIIHHFLYEEDIEYQNIDITMRPKTYFPHRTKANLSYSVDDNTTLQLIGIQVEIDLTLEYKGRIAVFEGKNGKPDSFSIYQIFHPFLYYYNAKQKEEMRDKIKEIVCVYVLKHKIENKTVLSLWSYNFTNPLYITSINFLKSASYLLTEKKGE